MAWLWRFEGLVGFWVWAGLGLGWPAGGVGAEYLIHFDLLSFVVLVPFFFPSSSYLSEFGFLNTPHRSINLARLVLFVS